MSPVSIVINMVDGYTDCCTATVHHINLHSLQMVFLVYIIIYNVAATIPLVIYNLISLVLWSAIVNH